MENFNKTDDISTISETMSIPYWKVRKVVNAYLSYLRDKVDRREPIGFLRVCEVRVKGYEGYRETYGYTCCEVARSVGMEPIFVRGILDCYEDLIISDLRKCKSHTVTGLLKIRIVENYYGKPIVSVMRSTAISGVEGVYLGLRRSFRRKVENDR